WGYKLAVRDVTGVPVVKALEGPMRIQPEEPGGVVAPHQGLAVNDVAALGTSAGPVDQLRLAPPVAELTEEDVPAHAGGLADPLAATGVTRSAENPATAPLPSNGGEINADAAVAEALGLTDIPGLDATFDTAPSGVGAIEVIPESVPGVTRSPRPMPKPAGFAPLPEITAAINAVNVSAAADRPAPARPGDPAAAAPTVVLGQEIDPAAVDPAARLVQLGAFQSPDEARAGWQEIAAQNPQLFDNRNWTIERREAGGTPFYRLRAMGFGGLQDARAFCAALVAAKGTCVPVVDNAAETAAN
ncbi:MAG: SPOR domain-containing protein, partial [Maritimibacter sp.]|nr:SPOR domain-containing protein [Maritimibacter sp.]